jgi:hypothetical protein
MSKWDYFYRSMTEVWNDLLGFGIVIAGFYVLWVAASAIVKWGGK